MAPRYVHGHTAWLVFDHLDKQTSIGNKSKTHTQPIVRNPTRTDCPVVDGHTFTVASSMTEQKIR